ncbi:hypothetical protein GX48_07327 [Paracoccidioides brasiliensis]|nr:hypothetical protein GX48_07327 [Paracoccidioides brasiliensis]
MAIASLFVGSISDNLGRTRAIALGALLYAIGASIEAGSRIIRVLLFGRLVAGVGEGFFLSTLVAYICEISAAKHRGLLSSLIQFFITSGPVMGYFSCYGTVSIQSSFSWRFPIAMQSGIAPFLTAASLFYLPDSPRWLFHHGHGAGAEAACIRLGISIVETDNLVEREEPSHEHRNEEESSTLVLGPGARKQALLGAFLMSMQQFSGIDGVIYVCSMPLYVLSKPYYLHRQLPLWLQEYPLSSSVLLLSLYADKIGRRASALYGGSIHAANMALIGSLYASNSVHAVSGAGRWVVIVSIYLSSITYSMS